MWISQKCQYAVRATFELAKRIGRGPVRIADVAEAQAIPVRFLEVILAQLKQGGFVESQRGNRGGYVLAKAPTQVTVGDIVRFVEGPLDPVACALGASHRECRLYGDCVFLPMWERVKKAVTDVYDGTSFQDLVEQDSQRVKGRAVSYSI